MLLSLADVNTVKIYSAPTADSTSSRVDTSVRASDFQGDLKENISSAKLKPVRWGFFFIFWTRKFQRCAGLKGQLTEYQRTGRYIYILTDKR